MNKKIIEALEYYNFHFAIDARDNCELEEGLYHIEIYLGKDAKYDSLNEVYYIELEDGSLIYEDELIYWQEKDRKKLKLLYKAFKAIKTDITGFPYIPDPIERELNRDIKKMDKIFEELGFMEVR